MKHIIVTVVATIIAGFVSLRFSLLIGFVVFVLVSEGVEKILNDHLNRK